MKKLIYLIIAITVLGLIVTGCNPVVPPAEQNELDKAKPVTTCTTIQSGEILTSTGDVITVGFDDWGYNYQAFLFNGFYHNSPRPDPPYTKETIDTAPSTTWMVMKWNDAWLSNKDCDGDGLLDRHYGYATPIGSGAWCTNHQSGEYINDDGETCNWTYFVKIVAAPEDAYKIPANAKGGIIDPGTWYTADGTEIGPVIWTSYAVIQRVYNDPCAGEGGVYDLSPAGPGFGQF